MSAKWDRSWTRIGRYDGCRRRSTWARVEVIEGPPSDCNGGIYALEDYTAIELCSGREGDDAYIRVERGDPAFAALLDVVLTATGNIDEEPSKDEWFEDEVPPEAGSMPSAVPETKNQIQEAAWERGRQFERSLWEEKRAADSMAATVAGWPEHADDVPPTGKPTGKLVEDRALPSSGADVRQEGRVK